MAAAVITVTAAWPADISKRADLPRPDFRASSTLVVVPVTVVDRRGAFVNGLRGDAFTLTEDGVPQPIRSFSEDDTPVSLGIVLDLSGSMKGVLGAAKQSFRTLMNDADPDDQVFLNGVSTRPRAYSGFEDSFEETLSRVESEGADGWTALIDTVYGSLKELRTGVHPRKALVVISDGMDNHSRHTRDELLRLAEESDAQIYTIAVAGAMSPSPSSKPIAMTEAKQGLLFLDELAARTGGLSFAVNGGADVARAAASIDRALRNQYVIGYSPSDGGEGGRWRKIRVKVGASGMRTYARAGYRRD